MTHIIGGLLDGGAVHLLPAAPGAGKSTLAYNLAYCVAMGLPFGDRYVERGRVLIVQADEGARNLQKKLKGIVDPRHASELSQWLDVWTDWEFTGMEALRKTIAEKNYRFVVFDSYTKLARYLPVEEKDTAYADPLMDLSEIAHSTDTAMLVIHHTNKAGTTRGTTALDGNVDEVWWLTTEKNESGDTLRVLTHGKSRDDIRGKYLVDRLSEESFRVCLREYQQSPERSTVAGMLAAFFRERAGTFFELKELAEYFLSENVDTLRKSCQRLAAKGVIRKRAITGMRNAYGCPEPKKVVPLSRYSAQSQSEQGIESGTSERDNVQECPASSGTVAGQERDNLDPVVPLSNPDPASVSPSKRDSGTSFSAGDAVEVFEDGQWCNSREVIERGCGDEWWVKNLVDGWESSYPASQIRLCREKEKPK